MITEEITQVRIAVDDDPVCDPRDNENLGTIACLHKRYVLGDGQWSVDDVIDDVIGRDEAQRLEERSERRFVELFRMKKVDDSAVNCAGMAQKELAQWRLDAFGKLAIWAPVYMYDHSGITISLKPFGCPWDSGQIGIIYATYARIRTELQVKRMTARVRRHVLETFNIEIEEYNDYLTGNVWGCELLNAAGDVVESYWGFLGDYDKDSGIKEYVADHLPKGSPLLDPKSWKTK